MNLDDQIRQAQRDVGQNPDSIESGVNLVRLLMIKGEIEPWIIQTMAGLKDKIGLTLFPNQPQLSTKEFLENANPRLCVEFAVWCVQKVLPFWEKEYPDDKRPKEAVEAAKNWLNDPSSEAISEASTAAVLARISYERRRHWVALAASNTARAAASPKEKNLRQHVHFAATDAAQTLMDAKIKTKTEDLLLEFLREKLVEHFNG